jgi:hypothetical protein
MRLRAQPLLRCPLRPGCQRRPNFDPFSMRGGAPAVEQSRQRQDERTRAHRCQAPGPGRHSLERFDECGIDQLSDEIVTAGHHDGISGADRRNGAGDSEAVPIEVITSCPSTDAISSDIVRAEPVGFGEHLGRSSRIQQLHAIEDNDRHHTRCCSGVGHVSIVSRHRRRLQAMSDFVGRRARIATFRWPTNPQTNSSSTQEDEIMAIQSTWRKARRT